MSLTINKCTQVFNLSDAIHTVSVARFSRSELNPFRFLGWIKYYLAVGNRIRTDIPIGVSRTLGTFLTNMYIYIIYNLNIMYIFPLYLYDGLRYKNIYGCHYI